MTPMTRMRIKQPHLRNNKLLQPHQPLPPQHPPPLPPKLPPHPPIHQHLHQHTHTRKKQNPSPHPPKPPTTSSQAQPLAPPPRQKKKRRKRLQQLPRQRRRSTRKAMRRIGSEKIDSRGSGRWCGMQRSVRQRGVLWRKVWVRIRWEEFGYTHSSDQVVANLWIHLAGLESTESLY